MAWKERPGVDYKRAGRMRGMPASDEPPVPPHFVLRSAWAALVRAGMAEARDGLFRRSPAGDLALAAYDAGLPDADVAVLALVRDDPNRMKGEYALQRLVGAGLVGLGVKSNGVPAITAAGLALLDGRGIVARG